MMHHDASISVCRSFYLSAYARQPARGPTLLAHLVAMLAYVGLTLTHVEPKEPKNGNSKKNTVKRRIV